VLDVNKLHVSAILNLFHSKNQIALQVVEASLAMGTGMGVATTNT
jgi:hypothetical protein